MNKIPNAFLKDERFPKNSPQKPIATMSSQTRCGGSLEKPGTTYPKDSKEGDATDRKGKLSRHHRERRVRRASHGLPGALHCHGRNQSRIRYIPINTNTNISMQYAYLRSQHRPLLRRPLPTLYQPIKPEWHSITKRTILTRTHFRGKDRRVGNVRAFRWLGCREHEDNGEESGWRIRTERDEDVDYKCRFSSPLSKRRYALC